MNNKVANILVTYLESLAWTDKLAGLTQVAKVTEGGVEKRFPISCGLSYEDACQRGCYDDLMPDSQKRSVLYFEDRSFNFIRQEGGRLYYESRLRLVCWLNYKLIEGGCGSSGDYIIDVIKALPAVPRNVGDLLRFTTIVASQVARGADIFGKYTFDEKRSQYLMLPYDFFAIDLRTTFFITTECIEPDPGGCTEC